MASFAALLVLAADLIFTNGTIWTGDPARPRVEALAVHGERILYAGSKAGLPKLPGARVIDLNGRMAMPGFNDAHTHFLGGSTRMAEVDLTGICTVAAIQAKIRSYAAAHPQAEWITGGGWEYYCFPAGLPGKALLDAAVPDRPAFLPAYDGHTGWANSRALRRAEITRDTVFKGFGEVVKDASGEPTGALKEGAQSLVRRHIPPLTRAQKMAAIETGLRYAARLGITSFQNASGSDDELSLYEELRAQGKLTARIRMAMSAGPATDLRSIKSGAVKFALDGVIESHTAAMLAPYSNNRATSGSLSWPRDAYIDAVVRADKLGLQIFTHAIGDLAVRTALDAYEEARRRNGERDSRHRVEHIETIDAADIPRFAKLNVLASMEPIHADPATIDVWSQAIGPARLPRSFPWRSLESAGARLVFSTDWPATISCDPIRGIHNAVNRLTTDGKPAGGWIPAERITLESALRAFTSAGAYASFEEGSKGTLSAGKLADIVVLSEDLFRTQLQHIHQVRVVITISNGRVIHQ